MQDQALNLFTPFTAVPDPRSNNGRLQHPLLDILAIALCAVLSDAESFVEMEEFGHAKQDWLQQRLGLTLPHGIPSHDTFRRVFARLDPVAFERCFMQWTQSLQRLTQNQVIAVDGKTLRHSFDTATGQSALHLVTAWASENRLVLAQEAVDQKSNEITAVPRLLELLDLRGSVVTVDALNTQKPLARQILAQGGDYLFALKENHGTLYRQGQDYFSWLEQRQPHGLERRCDSHTWSQDFGHGRREVRRCWSLGVTAHDWPEAVRQWTGLRSSGRDSAVWC